MNVEDGVSSPGGIVPRRYLARGGKLHAAGEKACVWYGVHVDVGGGGTGLHLLWLGFLRGLYLGGAEVVNKRRETRRIITLISADVCIALTGEEEKRTMVSDPWRRVLCLNFRPSREDGRARG